MKNDKAGAEVFPALGTYSDHLPFSQILWCPSTASVISK